MDKNSEFSLILTDAQVKALAIIRDHGPLRPREFARLMWPDSDGWRRHSRSGPNGSCKGGGMHLAGGAYLAKLNHLGLVYFHIRNRNGYSLSTLGKVSLEESEKLSKVQ